MLNPVFTLWLACDQVKLSTTCTLLRSTNVGVLVSGPSGVRPDTEMLPNRVPGTKNSRGSNVVFSVFAVASKARFHATFTTLSALARMIHLCSPTTDCVCVRVLVVHSGIAKS